MRYKVYFYTTIIVYLNVISSLGHGSKLRIELEIRFSTRHTASLINLSDWHV
uniref:Uncharacterized protein n=1 Tax=Rhizophagus irregularis (strain DAOM 181602 / DAOM 197198 / MUCL 43194) TaxID=747089 RepID=U9TW42_RHIID